MTLNSSAELSTLLPPFTKATRPANVIPRATGAAHNACLSHCHYCHCHFEHGVPNGSFFDDKPTVSKL
jgi:hypothetical protein